MPNVLYPLQSSFSTDCSYETMSVAVDHTAAEVYIAFWMPRPLHAQIGNLRLLSKVINLQISASEYI